MLHIVAQAGDADPAAIDVTRELTPDLLLLGMSTFGSQAVETLQELRAAGIPTRTIVITPCVDSPEVLRALQLGVCGVIPNDSTAATHRIR